MRLLPSLALLVLISVLGKSLAQTTSDKCKILNRTPIKASPSLEQCYRDNAETCCNSYTDQAIKSEYTGLLSDSCARNFPVSAEKPPLKK